LVPLERVSSNPEGKLDLPIVGELNPPKNQWIPWRNQEIANGETWGALTVALEKWRVKKSEGVSLFGEGVKNMKIGLSGYPKKAQVFFQVNLEDWKA
jgi:hypothetical protein